MYCAFDLSFRHVITFWSEGWHNKTDRRKNTCFLWLIDWTGIPSRGQCSENKLYFEAEEKSKPLDWEIWRVFFSIKYREKIMCIGWFIKAKYIQHMTWSRTLRSTTRIPLQKYLELILPWISVNQNEQPKISSNTYLIRLIPWDNIQFTEPTLQYNMVSNINILLSFKSLQSPRVGDGGSTTFPGRSYKAVVTYRLQQP